MSYNIQSLRGSRPGVIAAIRAAAPDVLCLQEVPRFVFPGLRARRLAHACGLVAVGRGRLASDTVIFVRQDLPVRRAARVRLSRTRGLHQRGAAVARLGLPLRLAWPSTGAGATRDVTVASVHLGLDAAERARHAREVLGAVSAFGRPFVVAGDLNEGPTGTSWAIFGAHAVAANNDRPTFPSSHPEHVIDTAFATADISVRSVDVPHTTASDHLPVLVTFRF